MEIKLKHISAHSELNRLRNPFTTFRGTQHDVKTFPLFGRVSEDNLIPPVVQTLASSLHTRFS